MITYFDKQLKIISDAIHSMDDSIFSKLVEQADDTLERGNKIIASGLGKNVPICEKFVGSMISLGMEASFLHTNSAVHGDLGNVKEGDLVILLSKSGETEESIYLADLLKERTVNLWLLTFTQKSTLTKCIENCVVLQLEQEGDPWNIMPNNSTTLNLIVLQGIVMQLAVRRGVDISELKRNHPGGNIGLLLQKGKQNE